MAIVVELPRLSDTMEEGVVAKWRVAVGDKIKRGQVLAEIETDKATMEFEAVDEGVIGKLLVAAGTAGVKVNDPIALLLDEGEDASAAAAPAAKPAPKADAPKAEAPAAATAAPAPAAAKSASGGRIIASPLAKRIAAEKGIDLATVKGSGPNGRIVKADLDGAKPATKSAPAAAAPSAAASAPAQGMSASTVAKIYEGREYTEVPLDGMRRTIAARLTEAKQTIPHFYLRRSVQLDDLMAFRAQLYA
jgi:pyruvate dehydrogenase E2 component (dihydrolipoamide acetyltransferase)